MARRVSHRGANFVAAWEGFRSCPYQDAVGVWTIGYGETQGVGPDTPCVTRRAAFTNLKRRLNRDYAEHVHRALRYRKRIKQQELDALASFAYNNGVGSFLDSTMLKRLNKPWARVFWHRKRIYKQELPKWVYGGGTKLPGLIKRRAAEVRIAVHGDYSSRP